MSSSIRIRHIISLQQKKSISCGEKLYFLFQTQDIDLLFQLIELEMIEF